MSVFSDVKLVTAPRIPISDGGEVIRGLAIDDDGYCGFGEAYLTKSPPGAVRAWKKHLRMTLNLTVVSGDVWFVFLNKSGVPEFAKISERNGVRLTVPPGLWFGFKNAGPEDSLILNVADITHDPDEMVRVDKNEISFDWEGLH